MEDELDWLVVSIDEPIRFDLQYWKKHDPWATQQKQLVTRVLEGLLPADRASLYQIVSEGPFPPFQPLSSEVDEVVDYIYGQMKIPPDVKQALLRGLKRVLSDYGAHDKEVGYSRGMDVLAYHLFLVLAPNFTAEELARAEEIVAKAYFHIMGRLNFRENYLPRNPGIILFMKYLRVSCK